MEDTVGSPTMHALLEGSGKLILAIAVLATNLYILHLLLTGQIKASTELTFAIVNGSGISVGMVLNYFFGSSSGSAHKDRLIQQQQNNQPPTVVAIPVPPVPPPTEKKP